MNQSTWRWKGKVAALSGVMALTAMSPMLHGQVAPPATAPSSQPATQAAIPPQDHPMLDRVAEVAAMHITTRHGDAQWRQHQAVQAEFSIELHGKPFAAGTMVLETNRDRVRVVLSDGTVIIRDGDSTWVSPADADVQHI